MTRLLLNLFISGAAHSVGPDFLDFSSTLLMPYIVLTPPPLKKPNPTTHRTSGTAAEYILKNPKLIGTS